MRGADYVTCQTSGRWTRKPTCYRQTTTTTTTTTTPAPAEAGPDQSLCPDPGYIKNGDRMSTPPITSRLQRRGFRLGTQMTYYCVEGYQLQGTETIFCVYGGKWSSVKPSCESAPRSPGEDENKIYCRDPGTILNGKVAVFTEDGKDGSLSDKYLEGTILEYECQNGYEMIGSYSISCEIDGFWSGVTPSCVEECGKVKMRTTTRITNGKPTVAGQWPWMVAVATVSGGESTIECGGVLIDRRHILTAAHCLDTPGTFELYFGKYHRNAALDDKHNLTVTTNPHYNSTTYDSDIALVRFTPDIHYSTRIQPICLPTTESTADNIRRGKSGIVAGWGTNEKNLPSDALYMAFLPVLPGDHCAKAYQKQGKYFPITSNMYCSGFEKGGTSICMGDSGSPMVFYDSFSEKYTLEGLVSFGVRDECSEPERYTVIIKVLPYLPWVIRTKLIS
ncbi:limulus clotting factor C-like [Uloborus diversus]|uniref:limulus clotting factor C-like n=1 Tax=Uloborus diversus TaxID=327109 RepID=UPI00240975DF|nr:limulus clotting factor C-like [Uloborus diversus]